MSIYYINDNDQIVITNPRIVEAFDILGRVAINGFQKKGEIVFQEETE